LDRSKAKVVTVAFLAVPAGSSLPSFRRGVFRNKGPFEGGVPSIADLEREVEAGFDWISGPLVGASCKPTRIGKRSLQNALLLNHMDNQVQTPASEDCTWTRPSSKNRPGSHGGRIGKIGCATSKLQHASFGLLALRRGESHSFVIISKCH
jgi:hypothetical protein